MQLYIYVFQIFFRNISLAVARSGLSFLLITSRQNPLVQNAQFCVILMSLGGTPIAGWFIMDTSHENETHLGLHEPMCLMHFHGCIPLFSQIASRSLRSPSS